MPAGYREGRSHSGCFSSGVVAECSLGVLVELAGQHVKFELLVPRFDVEGREPATKVGKFTVAQFLDVVLDTLDSGH